MSDSTLAILLPASAGELLREIERLRARLPSAPAPGEAPWRFRDRYRDLARRICTAEAQLATQVLAAAGLDSTDRRT